MVTIYFLLLGCWFGTFAMSGIYFGGINPVCATEGEACVELMAISDRIYSSVLTPGTWLKHPCEMFGCGFKGVYVRETSASSVPCSGAKQESAEQVGPVRV